MERKVVVVTGASAGVGRAIAHSFAKRKSRLALIARGSEGLEACRRECEELGGSALVLPLDVADDLAVTSAARRVESELGPIDVWVNNAMVSVFSPVTEMTPAEFRRVTEVTYLGAVYGTLAALGHMRPRNRGRILQIGSALAYRSIPLQSAYCAAKHALLGFTESLRCELLHEGSRVSVTMFELPAVNTPQFRWVRSLLPRKPQPVPPIYQPEVIAEAVYWASESGRKELVIGWPTREALLAEKLIPGLADRYLARTNYDAQQTDEQAPPGRRDNLFHPVPELASTHGDFDDRARSSSAWFWLTKNRPALLGGLAGAVALFWLLQRRSSLSNQAWPARGEESPLPGRSRKTA
jgi:NAD(P)-dependent dehydrogenase (short-subunit alcohol dehydrogenase family)